MELTVRTADRVQQGVLDIPEELQATTTVGQLLDTLRGEFKLAANFDYLVRSERQGKQLDPSLTLSNAGIEPGETLEVAPILQAGQ